MRGAISLAAALALPLEADGEPFPARSLLLFLTVAVVLATLLLQGLTLPLLLQRHRACPARTVWRSAEREARLALADVALARLDELEGQRGGVGLGRGAAAAALGGRAGAGHRRTTGSR